MLRFRLPCRAEPITVWPPVSCQTGIEGDSHRQPMTNKPLTTEEVTELTTGLNKLARNLWWTWDQEAQDIFQELSPRGWQNLYHNAVAILHEVSDYELRVRLQDRDFADRVTDVLRAFERYLKDQNTWASQHAASLSK